MKLIKKNSFFIVSVALHISVFLVFNLQGSLSQQEINLGNMQSHTLTSYIYQENFSGAQSIMNKVERNNWVKKAENSHKHEMTIAQQDRSQVMVKPQKIYLSGKMQQAQLHTSQLAGNNRPVPVLVAMLHAAIQKQQRYPASALLMEREGKITVTFVLFPSGIIDHLEIIKSSGTAILDEAAIAAVHNALPFKGIDKYLVAPQEYQITVAFELG